MLQDFKEEKELREQTFLTEVERQKHTKGQNYSIPARQSSLEEEDKTGKIQQGEKKNESEEI